MLLDEGDQVRLTRAIEENPRPGRSPKGGHPIGTVFTFSGVSSGKEAPNARKAQYIQGEDEFDLPMQPLDVLTIKETLLGVEKQYWVVTPEDAREKWWDKVDSKRV